MKIADLLRKLYRREDKVEERPLSSDSYDPTKKQQDKDEFEKFESAVLEEQVGEDITEDQIKARNKKFFVFGMIVVGVLVGIVVVIILYFKFIGSAFLEERVTVTIEGPERVRSAEESTYKLTVINGNRVSLENVKLFLEYPENMSIQEEPYLLKEGFTSSKIDAGSVAARGEKSFEVSFKPFGPRDRQVYLNATVQYQPKNFTSTFEKSSQKSITIQSSPITLTIIPTKEAANGDAVFVEIIVKNESSATYKNLEIRLDYPEGFTYTGAEPIPSRDKRIWKVPSLEPKEQIKFVINGTLEGNVDALKKFYVQIGELRDNNELLIYTENEGTIRIIASRVQLTVQPSKEALYPGDKMYYTITFKNTSDVPLRDLILYQYIDSRLIVKEEVTAQGGYYDNEKNVIYWKASDIPSLKNLQPGGEGSVTSGVVIAGMVPMNNENDSNFTVNTHAEIESLDVDSPIWQNKRIRSAEKITKIHSKLILNILAVYNDGELPNTGPIPLQKGKETTFTVRFSIMNTSNDLKNVIVNTSLPSGIIWKDSYLPENADIVANPRGNDVKWVLGTVDSGVGFISPVRTLAFQIGVKPSSNQTVSSRVEILNPVTITALDSFTEKEISYTFQDLTLTDISDVNAAIEAD